MTNRPILIPPTKATMSDMANPSDFEDAMDAAELNRQIATLELTVTQKDHAIRAATLQIIEMRKRIITLTTKRGRLRKVGQALRDHLIESSGDEILVRIDIPDKIWIPFGDALKED